MHFICLISLDILTKLLRNILKTYFLTFIVVWSFKLFQGFSSFNLYIFFLFNLLVLSGSGKDACNEKIMIMWISERKWAGALLKFVLHPSTICWALLEFCCWEQDQVNSSFCALSSPMLLSCSGCTPLYWQVPSTVLSEVAGNSPAKLKLSSSKDRFRSISQVKKSLKNIYKLSDKKFDIFQGENYFPAWNIIMQNI